MDQLIPIINKLQDVFNAIGQSPIDLPQIVVIGSQSSGKSSVLETIVGRDFLPRGTGVVTRRPLVLQLYTSTSEEYGEFLHLPGKKLTDFNAIRMEIANETDRVTGNNKGISSKTINLKIHSPNVLNLTLVDLPGITKVPVGDQPHNIEEQIREMCLEFISNPNVIILAVSSANTDLANSDALKMAKVADPDGVRTIGVLTKLDLMDSGTDALDMLQGRVIPLSKGFVGIVNRSQADINAGLSIKDSLVKEEEFFSSNVAYKNIAHTMGSSFLTKRLNTILMHHIRDCLPGIKAKINAMLTELTAEIDTMGSPTDVLDNTGRGGVLLSIISSFAASYNDSIDGRVIMNSNLSSSSSSTAALFGGARISYIFNQVFAKKLEHLHPFEILSDSDIRKAITNANGPRPSLFVPESSFEILSKRVIATLEGPALECVDLVFDELMHVTSECQGNNTLVRFGACREAIVDVVNKMLRSYLVPTQNMVSNLIKIELSYINTSHPDFIGGSRAIAELMDRLQKTGNNNGSVTSDREQIETEIIKSLLTSYFDIVRKNILDLVPKSIMAFLVVASKENVQNTLVSALYKDGLLKELLRESHDVSSRRETCAEMQKLLLRAVSIVNEVRDFNSTTLMK